MVFHNLLGGLTSKITSFIDSTLAEITGDMQNTLDVASINDEINGTTIFDPSFWSNVNGSCKTSN